MRLTSENFATFVEFANLAPSVHNTQLTRWRLHEDGSVLVFEETVRRLPVADAGGRDAAASHGAAIEGFAIACAAAGTSVRVERRGGPVENGLRPVARLTFDAGASADPLAAYVPTRRSYRGAFAKDGVTAGVESLPAMDDVTLVRAVAGLDRLARLNDEGALRTYRDAAYRAELCSWMRLSRRDPLYDVDGLNAEALEMSAPAAAVAGFVLAPRVFETLDRIGIGRPLVSEAAVVRSSQAVALFHRPADEDPLSTGRRFYRLWLEFESVGLAAAPMSVLADDPSTNASIVREFELPLERRLINAFRLGVPPQRRLGPKPRLHGAALFV